MHRGPFALTHTGGLHKILMTWGARKTWTAQRERAGQILRGMQAFHDDVAFTMRWGDLGRNGNGG